MPSFEFAIPGRLSLARLLAPSDAGPRPATFEDTYAHGFQAGYRQGCYKAKLELDREKARLAAEIRAPIAKLEKVHLEILRIGEQHLPQLLLEAVNRLFKRHYYTTEELTEEIRSLIKDLAQAQQITIECPPAELEALRERLADLGVTTVKGCLEWRANPDLAQGEIILQSDLGMVDGRRISKLSQLQTAIEGALP